MRNKKNKFLVILTKKKNKIKYLEISWIIRILIIELSSKFTKKKRIVIKNKKKINQKKWKKK